MEPSPIRQIIASLTVPLAESGLPVHPTVIPHQILCRIVEVEGYTHAVSAPSTCPAGRVVHNFGYIIFEALVDAFAATKQQRRFGPGHVSVFDASSVAARGGSRTKKSQLQLPYAWVVDVDRDADVGHTHIFVER